MSDSTYHVTVKGSDLSFECDVPKEVADRVALLVFSTRAGTENPAVSYAPAAATRAPVDDLDADQEVDGPDGFDAELTSAEFIADVGAKTYPEKIAAAAYFQRKHRGIQTFTKEQISAYLKQAGAGAPKNLTRDLASTLGRRWIVTDEKQPGSYHLTKTGIAAVEQGFGVEGTRKSADTARKPARRRRTAGKRAASTPPSEALLPAPPEDNAE